MKLKRAIQLSVLLTTLSTTGCDNSHIKTVATWQHTDNGAYAAKLSPYGQYAAVSTAQGVTLWEVQKNLPKYFWQHDPDQLNQVIHIHIPLDNSHAVTATDQQIALWSLNSGRNKGFWSISDSSISDVKISAKAKHLVFALINGTIEFYNLETGRRLQFLAHQERISSLDISSNGKYVISGSYDGTVLLWNTETAEIINEFKHQGRVTQTVFDSTGHYAFTANSMNESFIWTLPQLHKVTSLNYPMRQLIFSSAVFSHNGKLLATGAPNKKVKLWSTKNGKLLGQWTFTAEGFAASVLDFAFSEDDQHLMAENSFGIYEVWDISALSE